MCKVWVIFDNPTNVSFFGKAYVIMMPQMEVIGFFDNNRNSPLFDRQNKPRNQIELLRLLSNFLMHYWSPNTAVDSTIKDVISNAYRAFWSAFNNPAQHTLHCALIESPLGEITHPVRDFIKNDLRALVIQEVRSVVLELTNQLKAANEAEREAIINKLLTEIPKQKELIDALKDAMDKK
jgi:hypothetical protein